MASNDIDYVQPWRKTFPFCKPPTPGDKADARRFSREFPEGANGEDVGDDFALGDVIAQRFIQKNDPFDW